MRRICAWCKKELNPREDMGTESEITHGICSVCAEKFSPSVPKTMKAMLDLIDEPVLVVDSLGRVKTANERGLSLLGKDLDAVEDHLSGDALECSYARLPEGCGRTEHCRTCAIRNVLMDTLIHGRGYRKVPAYQKINTPNGDRIMRFYISTEKVGDQILLRIDDIDDIMAT
jgi:PAS domain-containing protein